MNVFLAHVLFVYASLREHLSPVARKEAKEQRAQRGYLEIKPFLIYFCFFA